MNLLEAANRAVRHALVLSGVESRTWKVLGHDVHAYRVRGEGRGPPMLMVHGLGSSANSFFRTMRPLAKHFGDVWALDLPGNGFSPLPLGGPLPVRDNVKVVLEFQRQVIGEPIALVGNSLGGAICLFAAVEAPQALKGLILMSPAGARLSAQNVAGLKRSFDVRTPADARAMTQRLFARPPLALMVLAGPMQTLYENPTVKSIIAEVTVDDAVPEAALQALSMPVLVVWGREEKVLPKESLAWFRANLPKHAELLEEPGFGHMPQMEHPARAVRRVLEFARRQGLVQAA